MRHRLRPSTAVVAAGAAMAAVVPVVGVAGPVPAAWADGGGGQARLVVTELPGRALKIGELRQDAVTVTNNGTAAAEEVVFRVRLTRGLEFPEIAAGCTYTTLPDQVGQALCRLETVIEPGKSITVPVRFKVRANALMEVVQYGTGRTGAEPGEGFDESHHRLAVDADSSADLAAQGDRAKGKAGSAVSVTVALRNHGPGWVQNNVSDDQPALMVTIPPGTTAVDVPELCQPFGVDGPTGPSEPGKPRYVCHPSDWTQDPGEVNAFTFGLKIKKGARDTSGEVKATSVYDIRPEFDPNADNDRAKINVQVLGAGNGSGSGTGGAGTGGAGGTGGTGDTAGTGSGGGSGSGSGPAAGGGSGTDGGGTGTGGAGAASGSGGTGGSTPQQQGSLAPSALTPSGSLAATGAEGTPLMAGTAVAATALGGVLVLGVRRRRGGSAS
ncbi:hypothetical protein ACFYYH_27280 [Streptomyces sp. NPDC002018]|uniref:hypothetical protein n=1 Tax=Streptomyces sp. NPDC002018 TaxID=3364629 RepID=UPI0036C87850